MDPLWRVGVLLMQWLLVRGTVLQREQGHSTALKGGPEGRTSHALQRERCRSIVLKVGPEGRSSYGCENSSHVRLAVDTIAALLCMLSCWRMPRTQLEVRLGGPTVVGGGSVEAVVAGAGHCAPEGAVPQHCVGGWASRPCQPWLREKQPQEAC